MTQLYYNKNSPFTFGWFQSICYLRRLFRKVYSVVPQQVPKKKAFSISRMEKRFKEIGNVHTKNLLGQKKTTDENFNAIWDIMENDPTALVKKLSSKISLGCITVWNILRRDLKM